MLERICIESVLPVFVGACIARATVFGARDRCSAEGAQEG